ncbi:hypothetical protein PVA8_292 [Vibrio phage PVA8]|nr:hypothetical protein [Vibrio phage PC-Liy1]URQ03278.1 hypothetical protein PVA8_292 [Vibrio phage PVA8]WBM59013.1 hypothetical protein vBValMPVA8_291 [Vibrio phage vB_ValM_PVA8]
MKIGYWLSVVKRAYFQKNEFLKDGSSTNGVIVPDDFIGTKSRAREEIKQTLCALWVRYKWVFTLLGVIATLMTVFQIP